MRPFRIPKQQAGWSMAYESLKWIGCSLRYCPTINTAGPTIFPNLQLQVQLTTYQIKK